MQCLVYELRNQTLVSLSLRLKDLLGPVTRVKKKKVGCGVQGVDEEQLRHVPVPVSEFNRGEYL